MRWKDLLWTVQAPEGSLGWLDWATGIVHLNATKDEFDALAATPAEEASPRSRLLAQTLTHENAHFLQVATTGYLYDWALEHLRLLSGALTELGSPFERGEDAKAALLAAERRLSASALEGLREHARLLDEPGPYGLTTRHLFESHALILENRVHVAQLTPDLNLHVLADASPDLPYRVPFDLTRFYLPHSAAFTLFPALVIAALCTSAPPQAFVRLLQAAEPGGLVDAVNGAGGDSEEDAEEDPEEDAEDRRPTALEEVLLPFVNNAVGDLLVGTAVEVVSRGSGEHPVYGPVVLQLNDLAGTGAFRLTEFMLRPERSLEGLGDEIVRPTLFRPTEQDVFPLQLPQRLLDAGPGAEEEVRTLLLISALANRVHQVVHGPPEGSSAPSLTGLSWLCDADSRLRLLEVDAELLASPGSERVSALLDPRRTTPEKRAATARIWGRCALSFDVDDETTVVPRQEPVRSFVRLLRDRLPFFPVYLDFSPGLHMFFTWFGALAAPEAWHGPTSLDIAHPSVLAEVERAARSMAELAESLELDVDPQLDRMIQAYEPPPGPAGRAG